MEFKRRLYFHPEYNFANQILPVWNLNFIVFKRLNGQCYQILPVWNLNAEITLEGMAIMPSNLTSMEFKLCKKRGSASLLHSSNLTSMEFKLGISTA